MQEFVGFSPNTFRFLQELKINNTRDWFELHRNQFQTYLQSPFENFVGAILPTLFEIDPNLENKPPKKILSRIYRDLRFSKDKSPYRPNMWASFHRHTKDWKEDPTFFFELMPDHYRYGMGFSRPSKKFMDIMREEIITNPQEFLEMNQLFSPHTPFKLMGIEYIRKLIPCQDINPELEPWYQKKGELYVMAVFPIDEYVSSQKLVQKIADDFQYLTPLYEFFWKLKEKSINNEES